MIIIKITAGLLALVMTFVAITLLFAPVLPISPQLSEQQRFLYPAGGFISLGLAVAIWLWATKITDPSKTS